MSVPDVVLACRCGCSLERHGSRAQGRPVRPPGGRVSGVTGGAKSGARWSGANAVKANRWAQRGRVGAAGAAARQAAAAARAMAAESPSPGPGSTGGPGGLTVPGAAGEEVPVKKDEDVNITHQARSILKISRDTEFLHSFLRVDHGTPPQPPHGHTR